MKLVKYTLGAALAAMTVTSAQAAEVELRLAHWVPPTHPIQQYGIEPWVESIKQASNGRINITIFPAQQLGAAPDHYDMTRDGITDIGYVNPGYTAGRFPIYSMLEVPFHATDATKAATAIHEWYAPHAEKEMADVKFCLMNPHDPGTIHSKKPIRVPADVKGLNVRPAHATMARFVNLLGGGSVQVPAPEAREALAKGAADAITFPWNSIYIFGIDSETKHHLDMPFYLSGQVLLINKDKYNGLAEQDRKVIDDHCTPEWSGRFSAGWAENEASGRQKMIESGEHTLYKPTDEEVALWREAAAPLLDSWKADVAAKGGDAEAIYAGYLAALEKHGIRY
ncbi:TRAP transporter substrate-binding protein [Polymorphum gilvum]|uniref:TRAP dicarboxylate transporter DctP subunit n=1 Tax=Polymorphum gilvum (strain LMG 25793 / CGMCC 1.9160 / SL003B-26A1) TaxID=991905 RepID=F2J3L7_POLGS|nr:TRAP transporter substrate-binding protein [Polymorphum gilvum]ADZ72153.1 TRAP dicarboxylate transporter DctP subunit [Polymorphum gilvum SL003B-26A1]